MANDSVKTITPNPQSGNPSSGYGYNTDLARQLEQQRQTEKAKQDLWKGTGGR